MQTVTGNALRRVLARFEGEAQVPAVIELYGGPVRADELEAVKRGVVDAGLGIHRHDDACCDKASRIPWRMMQGWQHSLYIEAVRVDAFLGRPAKN
jgi:hypothetical protein